MNTNYMLSISQGASIKYLRMSNKKGESRIMCFENKQDALKCKKYLMTYKTSYGHWPSLDMSTKVHKIKLLEEKTSSYDAIYHLIEITDVDSSSLHYFCKSKKQNFLLCSSFNTHIDKNMHNLVFSGVEYICEDDNLYTSIQNLNEIYKNF